MNKLKLFAIVFGLITIAFGATASAASINVDFISSNYVIEEFPGADNDVAAVDITVSVEAVDSDVYLAGVVNTSLPADQTKHAMRLWGLLEGFGMTPITEVPTSTSMTSSAEEVGANYKISEGDTETVTFSVVVNNGDYGLLTGDYYRVAMKFIRWNTDNSVESYMTKILSGGDYATPLIHLN